MRSEVSQRNTVDHGVGDEGEHFGSDWYCGRQRDWHLTSRRMMVLSFYCFVERNGEFVDFFCLQHLDGVSLQQKQNNDNN